MARRALFASKAPKSSPRVLEARQYGAPNAAGFLADGEVGRRTRITLADRHGIYLQNALYRKGVVKHSGDLVREWVDLVDDDGVVVQENVEWKAFTDTAGLKRKCRDGLIQAHVFDNGILELVYDDDGLPHEPVAAGARIVDINPLPRKTTTLTLRRLEDGSFQFGAKHRPLGGEVVTFHPDRVHSLEIHPDPEDVGGVSTAEAAYHPAMSMIQADSALGEIIRHHGPGFKHARVLDDDDGTIKTLGNILSGKGAKGKGSGQEMLRGIATGSNVEFENFDASSLDVSPHYEVMTIAIAAAIGMPVDTLKGVQAGAVAGSETNRTDYQDSLSECREMNLNPLIRRIVENHYPGEGLQIMWRPFPTSPMDAAKMFRERSAAIESLVRAGVPLGIALRESGLEIDEDELPDAPVDGFLPV